VKAGAGSRPFATVMCTKSLHLTSFNLARPASRMVFARCIVFWEPLSRMRLLQRNWISRIPTFGESYPETGPRPQVWGIGLRVSYAREYAFHERRCLGELPGSDPQIPKRFKCLRSRGIEQELDLVLERAMMQGSASEGSPPVKVPQAIIPKPRHGWYKRSVRLFLHLNASVEVVSPPEKSVSAL
jgi:hypothetical protein